MTRFRLEDLRQHSDVLRTRSGTTITVRFVEPRDAEAIQDYFRGLSSRARYQRFFGAIGELSPGELDRVIDVGEGDRFSVVATIRLDGREAIIGEARYALDDGTSHLEFGMSIDDRWHGQGIGTALLSNLECRAAAIGAGRLFGDSLRSNEAMIGLAVKSGYALGNSPGDWRLVRFFKDINLAPQDIPCASWKLAALSRKVSPTATAG